MISLQVAFPPTGETADGAQLRFSVSTELGVSKIVSGARAVSQHVAKLLLTRLGSDAFDVNAGSALEALGQEKVHPDNLLTVKNDISLAILEVQNQILDSQVNLEGATDDDLLQSLDVQTLEYNEDTVSWTIDILVETVAGNTDQLLLEA